MKTSPLLVLFIILTGCAYSRISTESGGYGNVLSNQHPIVGAKVTISDLDRTTNTQTDEQGRFKIPGEGKRILIFLMENPGIHPVSLTVEKDGYQSQNITVDKSVFGCYDIDFGSIELNEK